MELALLLTELASLQTQVAVLKTEHAELQTEHALLKSSLDKVSTLQVYDDPSSPGAD